MERFLSFLPSIAILVALFCSMYAFFWLIPKIYKKQNKKLHVALVAFGIFVLRPIGDTIVLTGITLVLFDSVNPLMLTTLFGLSATCYIGLGVIARKHGGKRNWLGYILEISFGVLSGYFAVTYQSIWVGLAFNLASTPIVIFLGFFVALIIPKIIHEKYEYQRKSRFRDPGVAFPILDKKLPVDE